MTQKTPPLATKHILNEARRLRMATEAQKTQPRTTKELLIEAQELTGTHFFPGLDPLGPSTSPTLTELLEEHKAMVDKLAVPFAIYHDNLAAASPQPVRWLWEKRIPLSGITLLDGDHGTGRSLLALQIAACVSSGTPMPDGTPTIQGGVVIVSPHTDATTAQLPLLKALGADLSRVKIISFIQDPAPEFHTSGHRPFSRPLDFLHLFEAITSVSARLVIFDPFISLLSRDGRWTDQRLGHLLADLQLRLIERNVACLLIRNCPAKGGHARPSVLERSDHFATIATSHLLLAIDPFQPNHLLLAHHGRLTPTLTLQIQPSPKNPNLPHITHLHSHSVTALDLMAHRPDTLHRRLLFQHLHQLITQTTDPIPVSTLYAHSPNSSPFQIQRSLRDLLVMGQIERPARGFYSAAPTDPPFPLDTAAATTSSTPKPSSPNGTAAITSNQMPTDSLNGTAAITPNPMPTDSLNGAAAITSNPMPTDSLNGAAAITSNPMPTDSLNRTAAITPNPMPTDSLNGAAVITPNPMPTDSLNGTAAITPNPMPTDSLNGVAAITPNPMPTDSFNGTATIVPNPILTSSLNGTAATTLNTPPASSLKRCPNPRHAPGCQCTA